MKDVESFQLFFMMRLPADCRVKVCGKQHQKPPRRLINITNMRGGGGGSSKSFEMYQKLSSTKSLMLEKLPDAVDDVVVELITLYPQDYC